MGMVVVIGSWSDPIPAPVVHVAPLPKPPNANVTSGAEDPPLAGFIPVAEPSFRIVSDVSQIHSSMILPSGSSGWCGYQAAACAFRSPKMMVLDSKEMLV